jgi:hypothetical protein
MLVTRGFSRSDVEDLKVVDSDYEGSNLVVEGGEVWMELAYC